MPIWKSLLIYKTKNNITDKESNSKNIGYRTDYTVINQVKTKRHISAFPNASYNMDDITAGHVETPKNQKSCETASTVALFLLDARTYFWQLIPINCETQISDT